jgi:predicted transposase/invertase (TIGR01784 family)
MEILKKKPDLKNAFGVLEMYSSDPEKQREFEERLRADENYAYELAVKYEKGIDKGKLEKSLETARKMLEEGFTKDQILRITGLSELDLQKNGVL